MKETVKWGIIGAANIAKQQLIPAMNQSSNGAVYAVASRSEKAESFASEFHIPHVYKSYEQLLKDDNIDAVYIALPNSYHKEWILKAIQAGKHVLSEKPIVLKETELQEIFSAAEEKAVHVMEAFMYRFHPQMAELKRLIEEQVIGDILTIRSRFHFVLENWDEDIRIQPDMGGGALLDIGCYCLNVMLELVEEEPVEMNVLLGREEPVDTHAAFVLRFPGRILGMGDCGFHAPMTNEVDIIGTKGKIHLPHAFRPDLNGGTGVIQLDLGGTEQVIELDGNSYLIQVEHFQNVIRGKQPLSYTKEKMLRQTRVLEQLRNKISTKEGDTSCPK